MRKIVIPAAAALLTAAAPGWRQQALSAAAPFIDKANDEWTRAIVTGDADILAARQHTNPVARLRDRQGHRQHVA